MICFNSARYLIVFKNHLSSRPLPFKNRDPPVLSPSVDRHGNVSDHLAIDIEKDFRR